MNLFLGFVSGTHENVEAIKYCSKFVSDLWKNY